MSLTIDQSLIHANDATPRLLGSTPFQLEFLKSQPEEAKDVCDGVLDTKRMAQITSGRATDHAGEVVILPNCNFDIDKTIFHSLDGFLEKAVMSSRVGVNLFWLDSAALRISSAFASVPAAPRHDLPLLEFMQKHCNFAMEHADGSFMDHLRFCYEYSYAHYKEKSPRVLLLHSIMGVGTNFFPMDASKIPLPPSPACCVFFTMDSFYASWSRWLVRILESLPELSFIGSSTMRL